MPSSFTVFVGHDSDDDTLAIGLKELLQGIFLSAEVFVSGSDLAGGKLWPKEIRDKLAVSKVIIVLVSPQSISTAWVLFEAGAGFVEDKTIPVVAGGLTVDDLSPPLSLLQARAYTERGLKELVNDIAEIAGLRQPDRYPGLEEAIETAENFSAARAQPTSQYEAPQRAAAEGPAADLQVRFQDVQGRIKHALVKAIQRAEPAFTIPREEDLYEMSIQGLYEIAEAAGISLPLTFLSFEYPDLPEDDAPPWQLMNAEKRLAVGEEALATFEGTL